MLWGRTTAFDPNALGSVGPDFKLSATVDDREPLAYSIATQHSVSEVSISQSKEETLANICAKEQVQHRVKRTTQVLVRRSQGVVLFF